MKCYPKEKSSQLFRKYNQYPIIAIQKTNYSNEVETRYLVCDDECSLLYLNHNLVVITDDDKLNFIKLTEKENNEQIEIDKRFINLIKKSLNTNTSLEFRSDIWDLTWLAKSLISIDFEISERIKKFMYNEDYKINLIEGFLEFATEYINFEKKSDELYEISFYKEEKTKSYLRFEKENLKQIAEDSENYIIEKLKKFIFKEKDIINSDENISNKICRKLYLMIDSIFIKETQQIYIYYDGYKSESIVFDYEENYYQLNLRESD